MMVVDSSKLVGSFQFLGNENTMMTFTDLLTDLTVCHLLFVALLCALL